VNVSSASKDGAVVEFSRAEVIALRNLLEYAPRIPLEARGPVEIFERLLTQFQPIAANMVSE
jgi:hypothetical protein